jgi:hypothetical protein
MKVEWLTSGRVKIERAKENIDDLKARVTAFHKSRPYYVEAEKDSQTGDTVQRIRIAKVPSPILGAIAGDAIHNLRSSLDVLMVCVMSDGRQVDPESNRGGGFPIWETPGPYAEYIRGGKEGSRAKARMDCIKAIKPYKGGNDALWALHVASIVDKHKSLLPAWGTIRYINFDPYIGMRAQFPELSNIPTHRYTIRIDDQKYPAQDGAVFSRVRPGEPEMDMNPKIGLEVSFGEPRILKGKPMLNMLELFLGVVELIVKLFASAGLIDNGPAASSPPPIHGAPPGA